MSEKYSELSAYLLIKRYQAQQDKNSPQAVELDKLIRNDLDISPDIDLMSDDIQDRFNNIVRSEKRKSEKFINVTAWIFIVITGLSFLGSGCGLMSLGITSRYMSRLAPYLTENAHPIFKFIIDNHILLQVISFFLSFGMFIVSIGILYRSDLARKFGITFLIYEIARACISPLMVKFVYPSIRSYGSEIPPTLFNSMYEASIAMSLLFSVIFIAIYGLLIYKFTSPEIKEEFK